MAEIVFLATYTVFGVSKFCSYLLRIWKAYDDGGKNRLFVYTVKLEVKNKVTTAEGIQRQFSAFYWGIVFLFGREKKYTYRELDIY